MQKRALQLKRILGIEMPSRESNELRFKHKNELSERVLQPIQKLNSVLATVSGVQMDSHREHKEQTTWIIFHFSLFFSALNR